MTANNKRNKLFPLLTILGGLLIIGALFMPVMKVDWEQQALNKYIDEVSATVYGEETDDYEELLDYFGVDDYDAERTDNKAYAYEQISNYYIHEAGIASGDNGISKLCEMQMIPGVACSVLAILLCCLLYWKKNLNRKFFYGVAVLSLAGLTLYFMDTKNYVSDIIASQSLFVMPKLSAGISAWVFAAGNVLLGASALGVVLRKNK